MEINNSCGCGRRQTIANSLDGPGAYSLICLDIPSYSEVYWMGTRPQTEVYVVSKVEAEEYSEDHCSCPCSKYM